MNDESDYSQLKPGEQKNSFSRYRSCFFGFDFVFVILNEILILVLRFYEIFVVLCHRIVD